MARTARQLKYHIGVFNRATDALVKDLGVTRSALSRMRRLHKEKGWELGHGDLPIGRRRQEATNIISEKPNFRKFAYFFCVSQA